MTLVRIEQIAPGVDECRVYSQPGAWDAEHAVAMNLLHEEPGVVKISMCTAREPFTRPMMRALRAKLIEHGIHTIRAHRRDWHKLPGAVQQADGSWRLDLGRLRERVGTQLESPPQAPAE